MEENMRKTISILVLLIALASPAFAGIMQQPVVPPPPEPTAQGDIQQPLTETIVTVLLTALSLG
jgi:hypothetical protein